MKILLGIILPVGTSVFAQADTHEVLGHGTDKGDTWGYWGHDMLR